MLARVLFVIESYATYYFNLCRAPALFVIQSFSRHFSLAISALHKSSLFFPSNELISNVYIKIKA